MQIDFHYYATYCAAFLAGYSHEESQIIGYSSQFTDCCSKTLLKKLHAPLSAATTQLQLEMMDMKTDILSLQEITRIWSSFHFLPYDLYTDVPYGGKQYKNKYRLICNSNGELVKNTVMLAKGSSLEAAGIAMHILADTWAHKYFAGTPSLVINNTSGNFIDLSDENAPQKINFRHNPKSPDDLSIDSYTNSLFQSKENSIMNLGHGRAGHLPDYSFIKYSYQPAWGDYSIVVKDNPSDYMHAFCQMVYALKFLKGSVDTFELNKYDSDVLEKYSSEINSIVRKRQHDASIDWKNFGEKLSGNKIEAFDLDKYQNEYINSDGELKESTFIGKYITAAMIHKSMVTSKIFDSGNMLAGFSSKPGTKFKLMTDYKKIIDKISSGVFHE